MHSYTITDRATGEQTELLAPNRDAALKAYVRRRLVVTRAPAKTEKVRQPAAGTAAHEGLPTEPLPDTP